ncbi:MAG: hypothetical protein HQ502_17225 [Alphaproteobacteria bacterium]|nr:hypothetical protein [Alphaproteobacteria bacterium]
MSIRTKIRALDAAGALTPYLPRNGHARRRLYLTIPALKDLTDGDSATNMLGCRGGIEAALTRWTSGGRVYGNKRRGLFLDRLDPPPNDIWEIRVTEPVVQVRLFGRFAEPDTLILTKFTTRRLLGQKGSAEWNNAMTGCEAEWNTLFNKPPFNAVTIHEYVTENCDDFPI